MATLVREPRRAYRDPDDRMLGGVASGVAAHLGVSALTARLAFLVLALLSGFGVLVYGCLWVLLPTAPATSSDESTPGLASATRRGARPATPRRRRDLGAAVSLVVVGLGVVIFLQNAGLGIRSSLFWPLFVAGGGMALLWWQSDGADREQWLSTGTGWKSWIRILAGLALLLAALWLALFQAGVADALDNALGALALAIGGCALVVGPWLLRLSRDLRRERAERVRSQERADVAAHLHDSVLQTLALIQRQATNAQMVTQLARTQERELRSWLFETEDPAQDTLRTALKRAAAEVEDNHQVPVEVVAVGEDVPSDNGLAALVAASREAMVNAAQHSGAGRIDVFLEVSDSEAEVDVRDRGRGFEVDRIDADRRGVRGSIVDRMSRHGGRAEVLSSPQGTEVRMWMPLGSKQDRQPRQDRPSRQEKP